ncbi:MAG TPA: carboxylesterase family protein [Ramlibacter sp.]|nr:carboxylesterase family protein [Ramlibacter sp.]
MSIFTSWRAVRAQWLAVLAIAFILLPNAVRAQQPVQASASELVTVRTSTGLVRGKVSSDRAVALFRGVPFAAPPVGDLRWRAPRPPQPWAGVRDAFEAGSSCPQTGSRQASTNEDCLYLNVWVPRERPKGKLPVMVFFHGGGQRQGAGDEYNAALLATRGTPAIVVTTNYRLNIFAFFAHPALTAEDPELGSGNYAALDQIQALRWVRANIAGFGGDPGKVTIFGNSGGGQAVCILMASPAARGLFQRALSQSAPCQWQYYPSLTASEERGGLTAAELGCKDANPLPCLRALPASAILAKERGAQQDTAGAQPAWGGGVFPLPMRDAFASGRINRVPLLQGATLDEALSQLEPQYEGRGKPVTAEQYPAILKQYFGESRVAAIQAQYPLANYTAPIYALVAALTDSGMVTNNRIGLCNQLLANQLSAPHMPTYSYVLADRTTPSPYRRRTADSLIGAAHGNEIAYVFNQVELTPAQRKVSDTIIRYWTNFAAKGDPNGKGLPPWPAFKADRQMVMRFNADGAKADADLHAQAKCKFWAEQGYASLSGPYPTPTATGAEHR